MNNGIYRMVGAGLVVALVSATAGAQSLTVSQEWYWAVYGNQIGHGGLVATDLEGDGIVDMVASAYVGEVGGFWWVAEFDGADYVQRWTSLPYEFGISRLLVAQVDGDPQLEIVIAGSYQLLVYDGETFELQAQHATLLEFSGGLAVADVDGDPAAEAAICDHTGTFVYDLDTGDQQLALPSYPCHDLAIGETDGTMGLELVVADGGNAGVVFDAASGAVEWVHPLGFGSVVTLGDLDGDTLDEIVAGFTWTVGLQVWHGDDQSFYWGVPVDNLSEVTIADVEGDGPAEVVYGEAQWGDLHVLDGATGSEKWFTDHPEHGTGTIAVGDLDGDTVNEIAFGPNVASRLQVIDCASHLVEWTSVDMVGPSYGLAHGDVDADGDPELVFTIYATDGGYDDGRYLIYDAVTKTLEYFSPSPTGSEFLGPMTLAVADVDADPQLEIIHPTAYAYDGALQCRDGLSHDVQWEERLTESYPFPAVKTADVDNDTLLEVVSTVGNRFLMVHEGSTGAVEWQSFDVGSFFSYHMTLLRVSDVDNDGNREILVAVPSQHEFMVVDPQLATIDLSSTTLELTSFDTADIDDDLIDDIVIGTHDGWIRRVDPVTAATTDLAGQFSGEIHGLAVAEVTGDDVPDYVFAAADRVHIVNGATLATEWISEDLGSFVGADDSLLVGDIDEDGSMEIWVNTGGVGHMVFGINITGSIFADGFESGDTSVWSDTIP